MSQNMWTMQNWFPPKPLEFIQTYEAHLKGRKEEKKEQIYCCCSPYNEDIELQRAN